MAGRQTKQVYRATFVGRANRPDGIGLWHTRLKRPNQIGLAKVDRKALMLSLDIIGPHQQGK